MKQLLILSGKGGTGKTTVASAFIRLSSGKAFADCDVDAPNLHLLMKDKKGIATHQDYFGGDKANIDLEKCTGCGTCRNHCRFDGIREDFTVDLFACEGCGVCQFVCPVGAVTLEKDKAGDLTLRQSDSSVFSTAKLKMGSGTSGKLVTAVKAQLREGVSPTTDLAIIDGSPGIGCPVIASLSGVELALLVSEPSISGISDLERIIKTAQVFQTPLCVCVNKYDTNVENTQKIVDLCMEQNIPFVGKIPFDPSAVAAINSGLTIVDIYSIAGEAVRKIYTETIKELKTR